MGLVANARFLEMFDFFTGFFLIDLCGDDGTGESRWPWQGPGASNESFRPELFYWWTADTSKRQPPAGLQPPGDCAP